MTFLSKCLRKGLAGALILMAFAMATGLPVFSQAQDSKSAPQAQQPQVPAAGGPQGDVGPYSVPKKKEEPPPERPRPPKNPPGIGDITITKDVPLVNVDVMVTTKDGQFIPNLQQGNFKVMEDGVPQQISNFNVSQAPITAVLLVEFASTNYSFIVDALNASYAFVQQLKKDDWVAVESYDMKPHILSDFTQDKTAAVGALNSLRVPTFGETNMYDAVYDTVDRLEGIEGRKYVVLASTGCDSFSKLTYDKLLKKLQGTHNITIFAVSTGQYIREIADARGLVRFLPCTSGSFANLDPGREGPARADFLQADNQMNTIAKITGGRAYFPRFQAQFPEIFHDIGASIRNQYTLSYHPTNAKLDGTFRKLKVELVDAQTGGPLKVIDQKGKSVKYNIVAREGYTAKHVVD